MTPTLRSRSGIRAVGLAAAAALLVAACSSSAAATPLPTDAPASVAPASTAAASAAPAGGVAVKVAQDAKLGAYLTGADGRSLYLLTSDSNGKTTCTTACAAAWPPLEVESAGSVTADDGVTGTIATITRADDGKMQVTYNGIPLYYFAKDAKAGDINGQGVKGVWFLVAPGSTAAGGAITGGVGQAPAATAAPAQTGTAPSPSTAKGY
jgi:predicted lipoprotein with Yx(FWY)xxD motif